MVSFGPIFHALSVYYLGSLGSGGSLESSRWRALHLRLHLLLLLPLLLVLDLLLQLLDLMLLLEKDLLFRRGYVTLPVTFFKHRPGIEFRQWGTTVVCCERDAFHLPLTGMVPRLRLRP